ncbi:hypothetical protein D3C85_1252380 [compost metagenome]
MRMRPHGAEEAGNDHIQSRSVRGIVFLHVLRDKAELAAQVPQIDRFIAEQFEVTASFLNRINLAVDQLEQGTLARSVGAENGNTLILANL